ncbi:hypothetical protein Btru_076181 [Bulinus truncatus]|nr:hypothetical protein Btru_076181 [Bulinus truncatus]
MQGDFSQKTLAWRATCYRYTVLSLMPTCSTVDKILACESLLPGQSRAVHAGHPTSAGQHLRSVSLHDEIATPYSGLIICTSGCPLARLLHHFWSAPLCTSRSRCRLGISYGGGTDPTPATYTTAWTGIDRVHPSGYILVLSDPLLPRKPGLLSSWTRRKLFRRLRKGKEAIINYDPDDASSVCSVDQDGDSHPEGTSSYLDRVIFLASFQVTSVSSLTLHPHRDTGPASMCFNEVYRDPSYPGEKEEAHFGEEPSRPSGRRYCFAPADGLGGPPRTSPKGLTANLVEIRCGVECILRS